MVDFGDYLRDLLDNLAGNNSGQSDKNAYNDPYNQQMSYYPTPVSGGDSPNPGWGHSLPKTGGGMIGNPVADAIGAAYGRLGGESNAPAEGGYTPYGGS